MTTSGRIRVVGEAEDGVQALDLIRSQQPDVALLDQQMPGLDGIDVVRAVVRDRLSTRVLMLSAVTNSAVVYRALELGAPATCRRMPVAARSWTPCSG